MKKNGILNLTLTSKNKTQNVSLNTYYSYISKRAGKSYLNFQIKKSKKTLVNAGGIFRNYFGIISISIELDGNNRLTKNIEICAEEYRADKWSYHNWDISDAFDKWSYSYIGLDYYGQPCDEKGFPINFISTAKLYCRDHSLLTSKIVKLVYQIKIGQYKCSSFKTFSKKLTSLINEHIQSDDVDDDRTCIVRDITAPDKKITEKHVYYDCPTMDWAGELIGLYNHVFDDLPFSVGAYNGCTLQVFKG